jgi:hypothetical protein
MKKVFDPCVNRTLELIDGQVASVMKGNLSKPKMVLVVGGFGRNPYLYLKIQEYCAARGISTRQPMNPWSAVARGAVCRGLEGEAAGLIQVRLARKFYGTPASEVYNARLHHPDDMYTDPLTGRAMAKGQMAWMCSKGDRLPEGQPRTIGIDVCKNFKVDDPRDCGALLVGCDDDEPPKRFASPSECFSFPQLFTFFGFIFSILPPFFFFFSFFVRSYSNALSFLWLLPVLGPAFLPL